jgi:hypothetical protein
MVSMKIAKSILILLFLVITTGCTCCIASDAEDNYTLGSALTKLSAAVESSVQYDAPPPGMKDLELLQFSTKHDPKLLEPFSEYLLKTLVQNGHAIVLVCDRLGTKAILEDAGCTSVLDRNAWKGNIENPCDFVVNLAEVCQ